MSFYYGGQRFKSRPPVKSDPPQPQSQAGDTETHPLRQHSISQDRQHSISQDNSPTLPTKQPMASNPTSYAARAQGIPPLSVDTSPSQPTPPSYASPGDSGGYENSMDDLTPTVSRRHTRSSNVPDRSPLQTLEVKLGDISKEEKRARVEEAERKLRARRESGASNSRSIPRKPVRSSQGSSANGVAQRSQHDNQNGHDNEPSSGRKQRKTSVGLDPFPSRDRRYGYDASRTGGAAAAAVGAYQLSRRPTQRYMDEPDEATYEQQVGYGQASAPRQNSIPQASQPEAKSTGNRNLAAMPKAQKILGEERIGTQAGANAAQHAQQSDPVPRHEVRRSEPGMNYNAPPQTVAGQEAREAVGMDSEDQAHEEYGGRSGRLKFSQVIHPFSDGTGRRYKEVEYLQDWRNAGTASLTAAEMDLSTNGDQQAWWEREQGSRRTSRGRSTVPTGHAPDPQVDGSGRTAFNPPLSLKCGPLLRYTGMRGDQGADSTTGRTFWRGSVMIVTEDATSSTEAPPILRLFNQPKQLYQPPAPPHNGMFRNDNNRVEDPVAGQTKCGPSGETLYVKHVDQVPPELDLSLVEGEYGLFTSSNQSAPSNSRQPQADGERLGRTKDVKGHRLHHERGLTFWRFNIEVELTTTQSRVAYRINNGPAIGFWVPAKGQQMNIMFHSCNGFSLSVDSNKFSGPDPLWRDMLNEHQQKPFHVMVGGGDQIYNDAATRDTHHFQEWLSMEHSDKYSTPFSEVLQDELEQFYLHRYAMWFSQGLFGVANSQIPMVNMWDDHDIIDGYGSYPHHFMSCPVFTGLGAVAFKYYMLFQHQSVPAETHEDEPSWVLGPSRGPYITQHSRSVYMSLGHEVGLIAIDCRTERMHDEVLSHETYEVILDRIDREVQKGEVKHLIVLLGIPIAYPRMTFAENILTSRAMYPLKALARTGVMGGVLNKFDGGVEVLDDLDDHWTAKHHKTERNWLIEDLQDFAAEKSVRITILGGDVHLAAVGQFYSKKKLAVPKDHDHRYIPNIISSAIVNTPPPEAMADFLNKRNKIHHLDDMTDEDMIPLFTHDVDGSERNNNHLLPRRNYCIIRPFNGDVGDSPPPSVFEFDDSPPKRRRSFSLRRRSSSTSSLDGDKRPGLLRRLSNRVAPPSSYKGPADNQQATQSPYYSSGVDPRVDGPQSNASSQPPSQPASQPGSSTAVDSRPNTMQRSDSFLRRPNIGGNAKSWNNDPSGRQGHIDLTGGLEVIFRCEINQKDPSGRTMPYRLIIPALAYQSEAQYHQRRPKRSGMAGLFGSMRRNKSQGDDRRDSVQGMPYENNEPATPAMAGDQRYTTMVEDREKAGLGDATTKHTDRNTAGFALDGASSRTAASEQQQYLRERATLDSLPRSGVVETEMPGESTRPNYEQRRRSSEQRRGSSEQYRGHSNVGRSRSRSQTDRTDSAKRFDPNQVPQTAEERAYWGAQQVRGELPKSQQRKKQPERGLRRYYASAFSSKQDEEDADPYSDGKGPVLGAVNNRVDLMPTKIPDRAASDATAHQPSARQNRRVISDPQPNGTHGSSSRAVPQQPRRNVQRPAEKDPYAHYMPEAVEAEFQSEDEVSELDDQPQAGRQQQHGQHMNGRYAGHDGVSEISSLGDNRQSRASNAQTQRESFTSAQTNTSLAQNRAGDDSPLYSDEDDLENMTASNLTASHEMQAQSPERGSRHQPPPQARPLSKIEQLTGASNSGQRASYASESGLEEDGVMARPVGQGSSGKAAKMLGADEHELVNGEGGVNARQSGGGRLGGLMRRLSERGSRKR